MAVNVYEARFAEGAQICRTDPIWQHGQGAVLHISGFELPQNYRVDFSLSNTGPSIPVFCTNAFVQIPNQVLVPGRTAYAWIVYLDEVSVTTRKCIVMPVDVRSDMPCHKPEKPCGADSLMQALAAGVNKAEAYAMMAQGAVDTAARVISLDATQLAVSGCMVHVLGRPVYVTDPATEYPTWHISAGAGWYVFARISIRQGAEVGSAVTVAGAAGWLWQVGEGSVDVAIRFKTAAVAQPIVIDWGGYSETFVFMASDLAIGNLDYLASFYEYDIAPFVHWSYALTADVTFVEGKNYYTLGEDGSYSLAEVTVGEEIPAETYYNHSKLRLEGMIKNVTYVLDELMDAPLEIGLPAVPEDGHGVWYSIQMHYAGTYSCVLDPPADVQAGTTTTHSQTAGINAMELHYVHANGKKTWQMINTHTNIT